MSASEMTSYKARRVLYPGSVFAFVVRIVNIKAADSLEVHYSSILQPNKISHSNPQSQDEVLCCHLSPLCCRCPRSSQPPHLQTVAAGFPDQQHGSQHQLDPPRCRLETDSLRPSPSRRNRLCYLLGILRLLHPSELVRQHRVQYQFCRWTPE